jgi:hypothetical protein
LLSFGWSIAYTVEGHTQIAEGKAFLIIWFPLISYK